MQTNYDENEIRKALAIMKPNGQLFEIRMIGNNTTFSGYFRSADTFLQQLKRMNVLGMNIYITLNTIDDACYDRAQKDKFEKATKTSTSDNDIKRYDWLMIDLDPKRPTGTSSTDEQLAKAKALQVKIFSFLREQGFNDPLAATSGNGYHLLYRLDEANTPETKKLIERTLKTLDMLFSNEDVTVDTANFNPARICKLYGTAAQKGSNTTERPHRLSHVTSNATAFEPNNAKYLEKICRIYPQQEEPQKYNNYSPRDFSLPDWLSKHGINYREGSYSEGRKYILEQCPFNSNHTGKDACIFQGRDGRIGFHCFHSSCSDKTWRDVRIMFEPDAYEKRRIEYNNRIYSKSRVTPQPQEIKPVDGKPVFFTASDILAMPKEDERFIKTGINEIDQKLRGLKKGYVSVMSGMRAAGKSSVISGIVLDCVQSNNRVAVYSGELTPGNFTQWLYLQAAGKGFTEKTDFEKYYTVKRETQEKIAKWLGDRFYLYNNEYGNNYVAMVEQFKKQIEEKKIDLLILDNLMALNIRDLSDTKYDAQTEFVLNLQKLAKSTMVHILFVAHPRKSLGFLRLDDISGTADLANAVDNAFIVHRVNNDFKRLTAQMFEWKSDYYLYSATNVIEIAKDRDGGTQDHFIPLYYEKETKRLRNYDTENKIYGWRGSDVNWKPPKQAEPRHEPQPPSGDQFIPISSDINEEVPFDVD